MKLLWQICCIAAATAVCNAEQLTREDLRLIERDDTEGLETLLQNIPEKVNHTSYRDGACTGLAYASKLGHPRMVDIFASHGADVNARCHEEGYTPLMLAALCSLQHEVNHQLCPKHLHLEESQVDSHAMVVRTLLKHHAQVELTDTVFGRSVAHFAAINGNAEILEILLHSKAVNPNSEDLHGWTPLLYAVLRGDEESVHLLVRHGANIDKKDSGGASPLVHAAYLGHTGIVQQLLDFGADCAMRDASQQNALDHALAAGKMEVVKLLEQVMNEKKEL